MLPLRISKPRPLKLIERAMQVEQSHTVRAIEALIDRTEEGLDTQIAERTDALDAFFEGLRDSEEPIRPQKTAEELSSLIRLPLRLTGEQSRLLTDDPDEFKKWLEEYLESQLIALNIGRVVGAIEHRLGEPLGGKIDSRELERGGGEDFGQSRDLLERQRERLTSQVERDLDVLLQRESGEDDTSKLRLLMSLSQGARTVFDGRTHRQVRQIFNRFSYIYLAAHLLENRTCRRCDRGGARSSRRSRVGFADGLGAGRVCTFEPERRTSGRFWPRGASLWRGKNSMSRPPL